MSTAGLTIISMKLKREDLLGRIAVETDEAELKALENWLAGVESFAEELSAKYLNQ